MSAYHSYVHGKTTSVAIASTLIVLGALTLFSGCSQKPSSEEIAAQTKATVDQAVAQAKNELLAEQAAEKAKQDAVAAAQAEEKTRHEAAVSAAKKELVAEQRAAANSNKSSSAPARLICKNCGVVVSVSEVEAEGQGSGLGVVAGGVVGGLLGNQVGQGTGRDLATIAGAVGGAFAGNKIEKQAKKSMNYDIVVKMDTGAVRTVHQATAPEVVRGDAVKIENDAIVKK